MINRMMFEVVGVYHTADASGPRGDFFAGRVFVPSTTFARAFATGNQHRGHGDAGRGAAGRRWTSRRTCAPC